MDMQSLVAFVAFFMTTLFALAYILDWDERTRAAVRAAVQEQAAVRARADAVAEPANPVDAAYAFIMKTRAAQAQAQADAVAALAEDVKAEKDKVDRIQTVVYQLVGGLFDQNTQSKIMNLHINTLLNRPIDVNDAEADSSEQLLIWPTTRQGDQLNERCERFFRMMETASNRIRLLESQMNIQNDNINDAVNESIDALEKKVREQDKKIAALEKEIYETTF